MTERAHPRVILLVRFKSSLSREELETRYRARMPEFRAVPGLLQKHYLHDPSSDEWAGLYLWDSPESLEAFLESDLRKSIAETYQLSEAPRIEALHVVDTLRS